MFLCLVAVILISLCPTSIVYCRSGLYAHTIVVLTNVDADAHLRDTFYDGPAGTVLYLPIGGYRVLDGPVGIGESSLATSDLFALPSAFAEREQYPYRTVLSDEWMLLEKPLRVKGARDSNTSSLLLHCRLPLPMGRTAVEALEERYLEANMPHMQASIEGWWAQVAKRRSSGCLYGDGEGALTGSPTYYELCPREVFRRVKEEVLHPLLGTSSIPEAKPDLVGMVGGHNAAHLLRDAKPQKGAKIAAKRKQGEAVLAFLKHMHTSHATRSAVLHDGRLNSAFETLGIFHGTVSQPRWNRELHVWEMLYPTQRACPSHFTATGKRGVTTDHGHPPSPPAHNPNAAWNGTYADGPLWKTIIKLRCPDSNSEETDARDTFVWSVTEVQQVCRYEVEITSSIVCGWEHELDSFRVTPIACVALG